MVPPSGSDAGNACGAASVTLPAEAGTITVTARICEENAQVATIWSKPGCLRIPNPVTGAAALKPACENALTPLPAQVVMAVAALADEEFEVMEIA